MKAFDLPKITIENKFDYDNEELIKEMIASPTLLTFYRTKEGESRFLFTGLGEEEYKLFVSQVHRLIPLHEFVKTAVINIEKAREGTIDEQLFMIEAIKYLQLNTKKFGLH
jgi:hypothetical protein